MADKKKSLWQRTKDRAKEEMQMLKENKPAFANSDNADKNIANKKKKKREY